MSRQEEEAICWGSSSYTQVLRWDTETDKGKRMKTSGYSGAQKLLASRDSTLSYFSMLEFRTVRLLQILFLLFVVQWFSSHCLSADIRVEIVKQLSGK